jgi:hypothetical protein
MDKQDTVKEDQPAKNHSKLFAVLFGLAGFTAIGLGIALWWCLWGHSTPLATPSSPTAATGPCTNGTPNDLPAGYSWYENADLGYKFAYPTAWGAATVTIDHDGATAGHYVRGSFATNHDVTFGGNATDYIVSARDGIPTDNPGFLEATSKFYAVQIWKLHDGATDEPKYALYPLADPTVAKDACNTKAVITQYPTTEFYGYAYDTARINLQPSNLYYGVNVVLKNPTAAARADLDKLVASFQLIP